MDQVWQVFTGQERQACNEYFFHEKVCNLIDWFYEKNKQFQIALYKFINPLMPVPAVTVKKIGIYTPVICDHSYIN